MRIFSGSMVLLYHTEKIQLKMLESIYSRI